jgi:hypothetical protein
MRRVAKAGAHRRGSGQEIVVRYNAGSRSSERTAAATDLALLGQGCGETLPSLHRIPTSYRLETNGERLYRLCLALVERNLADEKLWQQTGKVAVVFARTAVQRLTEEFAGGTLETKVDYCFEIRDDLGTGYWRGGSLGEGKLMAAFELQACGYLKIGTALEALEEHERFLGAAFYYLLRSSLYRWILIYDHTDAECYNEQLHEWMEQDEPESRDAYEFPEVEEAIPEPVRTAKDWTYRSARRLLRRHLQGPHSVWIQSTRSGKAMVDGLGGRRDKLLGHFGGVGCGGKGGQLLDGAIGQSGRHVGQVLANGETQLAAAFNDGKDGGDLGSSLFAAQVQPIPPAHRSWSEQLDPHRERTRLDREWPLSSP